MAPMMLVMVLFLSNYVYGEDFYDLPSISLGQLEKTQPIEIPENYTRVQISNLAGTLYSDSLSKLNHISTLRLYKNQLKSIEPGAICSSSNLKAIEIDFVDNNQPPAIVKELFQNCNNLESLSLIFNYDVASKLESDAFLHLASLKNLSIRHHKMDKLGKEIFSGLKSLTVLDLWNTQLKEISADAFEGLHNLEEVKIAHTSVQTLPIGLLKNTPKLKFFLFTYSNLTGLTWDEFEGLSSLETLILVNNNIDEFNAEKVAANLPNLQELSIELNPLPCKQKEVFVNELIEKLGHPVKVSYKFDPGFSDSCEIIDV